MKKKHIIIICSIICAIIAIALVLIFTIKPNANDDDNSNNDITQEKPQTQDPVFVVPSIINLYLSDTNIEINVSVIYDKNYQIVCMSKNAEVVEMNGTLICPKKIGSTIVETTLLYEDKQISKQTQVNVFEDIKVVECKIYKQENAVDKLFVGEKYCLKLTINSPIIGDFSFCGNNVVSGLVLKGQNDFEYCYEFSALNFGLAEFVFKFENFENKFVYNVYSYAKNIEVYVDDNLYTQNKIYLYLFNNQYKTEANNDEIFDCVKFDAKVENGCMLNCLDFNIENEIVEYRDGCLYAKEIGKCNIKIKTIDGTNIETNIEVVVQNVEPTEIVANDIFAKVGEIKKIEFSVLPIYAIYESEITCQDDEIIISENNISANLSGNYIITIFANQVSKTINFVVESKPQIVIEFPQAIIDELEIKIENNKIKLKYVQNYDLNFSYYFIDDKNNIFTKQFEVEVICADMQNSIDYQHENLRFIINIEQKTNFTINFCDDEEIIYQLFFEFC